MTDHQPATPTDVDHAGRSFGQHRAPGLHALEGNAYQRTEAEHVADRSYGDGYNDGYTLGRQAAALQTADERGDDALAGQRLTFESHVMVSEPRHFATADELTAQLAEPQVYAAGNKPGAVYRVANLDEHKAGRSDSRFIHQQPTPQNSGRARVQAGATLLALLVATLAAFVLGYVWGAGHPRPAATPHATHAHYARIRTQSDAPAPRHGIPS